MARLVLSSPDGDRTVELRARNSLGRHPDNSIQLLDKIVSKEHCVIELRGHQFILRDLGSLNGTYINGERLSGETPLTEGMEFALGQTRARFVGAHELPQPSAAPAFQPAAQHPGLPQQFAPAPTIPQTATPAPGTPHHPTPHAPPPPAGQGVGGFRPMSVPAVVPAALASNSGVAAAPASTAVPPSMATPASSERRLGMKTRIDLSDANRSIGTQIDATQKGFLPYDQLVSNPAQLAQDYERLRLSHELS
ncbi:MAG TPA: FHA domain-containing protein, partial [Polyangiaceae bacterium]|nr:FHA domain-containing protein [Polyangiaceae bacterium]